MLQNASDHAAPAPTPAPAPAPALAVSPVQTSKIVGSVSAPPRYRNMAASCKPVKRQGTLEGHDEREVFTLGEAVQQLDNGSNVGTLKILI